MDSSMVNNPKSPVKKTGARNRCACGLGAAAAQQHGFTRKASLIAVLTCGPFYRKFEPFCRTRPRRKS